jgi:hypothetical protein
VAIVEPVHWYHFFCGNDVLSMWDVPLTEHVAGLRSAGFDGKCLVGLVGGAGQQEDARRWLAAYWPEAEIAVTAEDGFEQVTLAALHMWCQDADPEIPVFYGHTKGAFSNHPVAAPWRRAMTAVCVARWRDRVADLAAVDAAGLHWLTPEAFPGYVSSPFFGGNFWWATAGYLASLAPVDPGDVNRYSAESWVGTGNPVVRALSTAWPEYAGCTFPPGRPLCVSSRRTTAAQGAAGTG